MNYPGSTHQNCIDRSATWSISTSSTRIPAKARVSMLSIEREHRKREMLQFLAVIGGLNGDFEGIVSYRLAIKE
jgi:hypothetical protein